MTDEKTDVTRAEFEQLQEEIEQRKAEFDDLREEMVFVVAVERVLLEYGIDPSTVDEIVADIEAVSNRLDGDDDV